MNTTDYGLAALGLQSALTEMHSALPHAPVVPDTRDRRHGTRGTATTTRRTTRVARSRTAAGLHRVARWLEPAETGSAATR